MANEKWVNTRVTPDLKKRYDKALEKAKKDLGRHVHSPEVVIPAITAFCDAVEAGDAAKFLSGNMKRK